MIPLVNTWCSSAFMVNTLCSVAFMILCMKLNHFPFRIVSKIVLNTAKHDIIIFSFQMSNITTNLCQKWVWLHCIPATGFQYMTERRNTLLTYLVYPHTGRCRSAPSPVLWPEPWPVSLLSLLLYLYWNQKYTPLYNPCFELAPHVYQEGQT